MSNLGPTLAGIMTAVAGMIFFLKPFPSCSTYLNLWIFQTCYGQLTVLGIDPNIFAGVVVITLAVILAVTLRDKVA